MRETRTEGKNRQDTHIEIENLSKTYITVPALRNVSLTVDKGESVGLVGANGAGKTTMLHILMGFIGFESGCVTVLGNDASGLNTAAKERIGFVAEENGLLPWATLMDLALLFQDLYPNWNKDQLYGYIDDWDIITDRRMRSMSKGQKRLAELALCFSCQPDLLILDEPFVGLDAVMRFRVLRAMNRLNEERDCTIFYSSHILSDIEKIARRVVIIQNGQISLDKQIGELGGSVETAFIKNYGMESLFSAGE